MLHQQAYDIGYGIGVAFDEFKEEDHPRGQPGNAGQFSSTPGSGGKGEAPKEQAEAPPKNLTQQELATITPEEVHKRLAYADKIARSIPPTDKIDTPERQALRKKIAKNLYEKDIANRKHEYEATIVLGLPASGKSTLAEPIIKEKGALEVDPDLAKAQLPEYNNGLGTFATHEESSAISREVMAEALANGDNIVWPRVDSPDKVVRDIQNLKRLGYKVHVKHLEVSAETAEQSAIERYLTRGRYVSPLVVREYGTKPLESYRAVQKSGLADSTEMFTRGYSRGPHARVEKVEE